MVFAGIAAVVAALFELKDRGKSAEQQVETKEYYAAKWRLLDSIGLLELPEVAIRQILKIVATVMLKLVRSYPDIEELPSMAVYFIPLIFDVVTISLSTTWMLGVVLAVLLVVSIMTFGVRKRWKRTKLRARLAAIVLGLAFILSATLLLKLILVLPIIAATLLVGILMPVFAYVLMMGIGLAAYVERKEGYHLLLLAGNTVLLLAAAMSMSFAITTVSLLIGNFAQPEAWVPKTLQMLFSNVVFDGITMVVTVGILGLVVREKGRVPVPVVVILDIGVAAVLACASLYLGLVFSENALSMVEVFRVLIGKSPEGGGFEVGPYFWVMHTAFLPTLAFLSIVLFLWMCKLVVLPVGGLLSRGSEIEKPHHYTAGAFGLVAVMLGAFAVLLGLVQEGLERDEVERNTPSVVEESDENSIP